MQELIDRVVSLKLVIWVCSGNHPSLSAAVGHTSSLLSSF